MSWQIQESVNLRHTDSLRTASDFFNIIARTDFSLLQHAKVNPGLRCSTSRLPSEVHSFECRRGSTSRAAGYFKFSPTDAVSIADAYLVIQKSFDGEVFPELAERKIVAVQGSAPSNDKNPSGRRTPRGARLRGLPRSACASPSILSLRTIRRPSTGDFQTDVRTVLPCHVTSRGRPTFTESNRGMRTSLKSSVSLESVISGAAAAGVIKCQDAIDLLQCETTRSEYSMSSRTVLG